MAFGRDRDPGYSLGIQTVKRLTEKAFLFEIDGEDVWIPKSQIHENSEIQEHALVTEEGELVITEWLAVQKNFLTR